MSVMEVNAPTVAPDVYKLSTPVVGSNGQISEVRVNLPRGRSFIAHGDIVKSINSREVFGNTAIHTSEYKLDFKAARGFIIDCCGLDSASVDNLAAYDFEQIALLIYAKIKISPTLPATS